jgi:pimeloyl-ACP methyl ester carboxylesterase
MGKLPPALFGLVMQQMRLRPMRRLPIAFGWLTKRGDKATAQWVKPILRNNEIRRDAVKVLRAINSDRTLLVDAAKRLPKYTGRALIIWSKNDRVMPPAHAQRLNEILPNSNLVEIDDTYTLIPLDRPALLAGTIRSFLQTAPKSDYLQSTD